jgi:serine/threonine-protein kinase RIO1
MAPQDVAPVTYHAGPVHWRVRSAPVAEVIRDMLDDPEAWTIRKDVLIQNTWQVLIARVSLPLASCERALLRRSNYTKREARWRDFFRRSGPHRAFRYALALERAGIATPRVLAAGIVRSFHVPKTGYLLVEEIFPAMTLAKLAQRPGPIPAALIRRVAGMIARMHQEGFIHGDLTINNVLLDEQNQPWFIDLERGRRRWGPVSWRQAVEDFHRFARHVGKFSVPARFGALRLLKYYCAERGWTGREREFAEAIFRRLKHKLEADRNKSSRPREDRGLS